MSVRLTFDLGAKQQYVIDCVAEGDKRLTIALDLRDSNTFPGSGSVDHRDKAGGEQQYPVNAIGVAARSNLIEEDEGGNAINRNFASGLQQLGQGYGSNAAVSNLWRRDPAAA